MGLPKIPTLEKFCFCCPVRQGVMYYSACLVVLWILYLISALVGGGGVGNIIWAVIWFCVNIVVYGLAVYTLYKDMSRTLLLPALFTSLFNVIVTCINCIINIVVLNIFGAIILAAIAGITAYYCLGLYTVYNQSPAPGPTGGEPADIKAPV